MLTLRATFINLFLQSVVDIIYHMEYVHT